MKTTLIETLQAFVNAAFSRAGYDTKFAAVRVSDRPDLADFQCNGLMGVAKSQKMNPMDAGAAVMEALDLEGLFEADFVKPGFLNFKATDDALRKLVAASVDDPAGAGGHRRAQKVYG